MTSKKALVLLVILIMTGFALRIFQLDHASLRGDEAFTVMNWGRQPLSVTLDRIATIDPHPPLSYVLFRAWALVFGTTEFTMRLLPALVNVLGIPAIYALGKRLGSRNVGLLAALLWAVHPFQIWHAQDVRNYAIWAALSPVAAWLALRFLERGRRVDFLLYLVAGITTAYIYYLELFTLAVLNTYAVVVYFRPPATLKRWFTTQILLVLALLPWFLQPRLLTGSGYGGTAGSTEISRLLTWFIPELSFGSTLPVEIVSWLPFPLLILLLVALVALWRQKRTQSLIFLTLLGVFPLIAIAVVSLRLNVFVPRYVLSAAPAYIILVSSLVIALRTQNQTLLRLAGLLIAVFWLLLELLGLYNYYFVTDYAKSPDWRALNSHLNTLTGENDLVINMAVDAAFGFYYEGSAQDIGLPTSPDQSRDELIRLLAQAKDNPSAIWTVGQSIPSWPNATAIPAWLRENYQEVLTYSTPAGLPIHQYLPWQTIELTPVTIARFGDTVELVGAHVMPPLHKGMDLTVWLYWRPLSQATEALKAFVHLIGDQPSPMGSPLWTQDDQFPQDGRLSTTSWELGTIYRDVYILPMQDVSEGSYHIEVGWYNPDTGARIPSDTRTDSINIGDVAISYTAD